MSQKRSKKKRTDGEGGLDTPAQLYHDLAKLVLAAPLPASPVTEGATRSGQREALAPAIAWGWLMRTVRSGQAAINMEANGYGAEASPLVRAALEHAIRLQWAAAYGDEFVEVALIAQKGGFAKLQGAQTENWQFSPELASSLEEHAAEASDEYLSLSNLTALRAIVDENQDRLGSLYMAWLFDTQESHPSLLTARHYFRTDEERSTYFFLRQSRFQSGVELKSC